MMAGDSTSEDFNEDQIPAPGDPDRKRMLNVLAQRRYRRRKRDRLVALEAEAKKSRQTSSPVEQILPTPPSSEESPTESSASVGLESTQEIVIASQAFDTLVPQDFQSDIDFSLIMDGNSSTLSYGIGTLSLPAFHSPFPNNVTFETPNFQPLSMGNAFPMGNKTQMSNAFSPTNSCFTDDRTLDLPLIKTVKAGWTIAEMLGCDESIFDATSQRTLAPVIGMDIPSWLQPTEAQQKIPHHPFIDILPWPSVRTKLIIVFSQPENFRPPSARDPLAIMKMIGDMDDTEEGFRISGDDGLDSQNWEIGQAFFNNWWWALSREIVDRSNTLRDNRGATRLKLMPPGS